MRAVSTLVLVSLPALILASVCDVCQTVVSKARAAQSEPEKLDSEFLCADTSSPLCHSFWRQYGLQVITLLETSSYESKDLCSHDFIKCNSILDKPSAVNPPTISFLELDEAMKARDREEMRIQDALQTKLVAAMQSQGVIQDVTSYEAAKAEKIEVKMKDILERFRRNASRLQAFRESLLSLAQVDMATQPISSIQRLSFTLSPQSSASSFTSFLSERESIEMGTMDVDERLDNILAMVEECKKIAKMNEMRLKDVRGSLTSLVQVGEWTAPLTSQERMSFLALTVEIHRAGHTVPTKSSHKDDDDDDDEEDKHALEKEQQDKGTIELPDATRGVPSNADFFAPPSHQHPLTADEKRAETIGMFEEMSHKTRAHRHHHRGHSRSTTELNDKLDRVLGTMQHIMLSNQDTNLRIKKIDRVGELVDQLEKMSADYSDAIGVMRGQFMSLIEVSSEVNEEPNQTTATHHHHHHHHHDAETPSKSDVNLLQDSTGSGPSRNLHSELIHKQQQQQQSSQSPPLTKGIDLLDLDTGLAGPVPAPGTSMADEILGGQSLIQSDTDPQSESGKLKRRLFPGGKRAVAGTDDSMNHAVSAPKLATGSSGSGSGSGSGGDHDSDSEEEEREKHTNEPVPPDQMPGMKGGVSGAAAGSVAFADGLLMQEHEKRMDKVISSLESLIKQIEDNFERIRELKRELDIFLQVDVETQTISPEERSSFLQISNNDDTLTREELFAAFGDLQIDKKSWRVEDTPTTSLTAPTTAVTDSTLLVAVPPTESPMEAAQSAKQMPEAPLVDGSQKSIDQNSLANAMNENVGSQSQSQSITSTPITTNTQQPPQQEQQLQQHSNEVLSTAHDISSLPLIQEGAQDILVDAGLAFDLACDLEFVIMDIELIRGKPKEMDPEREKALEAPEDLNKKALWEAMGHTLRSNDTPEKMPHISVETVKETLAPHGNEEMPEAVSMLNRFVRQAKRDRNFLGRYYPKK